MTPPPIDLDRIDELHQIAKECMDESPSEGLAAWRRAMFVQWPAISAELRAARAVVEAARLFTQGGNDAMSGFNELDDAVRAYDAATGAGGGA